ncbi:casein kinase II subunit beta-like [Rhopalosiphum maidis]|uniref:casein kinase II subunit beta-like n=1 Tax=Rhopalosiphum maidis TaxID=43146 RepID=UPI000EFE5A80|nr:casein kinase II subunit beta-like [Rhopalosiphum maidis]
MNSSPWIRRLLNRPDNAFMCAVDVSYIRDKFNLVGLEKTLPDYETAVRVVLGDAPYSRVTADLNTQSAAELFYGLVHARYVMTPRGIAKILENYLVGCYGHCPRENCRRSAALPIGLCDVIGSDTVRIYCPRCMDVYVPPAGTRGAAVDGAYFGTGLPHMVFMTRPEYMPQRPSGRHVAKLYGFRIHDSAYDVQRNAATQQLRRTMQLQSTGSTSAAAVTASVANCATTSTGISSIAATADTIADVPSNAGDQKLRVLNIINSYNNVPLLKR